MKISEYTNLLKYFWKSIPDNIKQIIWENPILAFCTLLVILFAVILVILLYLKPTTVNNYNIKGDRNSINSNNR